MAGNFNSSNKTGFRRQITHFTRELLAAYKRIRRIEFYELPKAISGKIRRVRLRGVETERQASHPRGEREFWEEEFPELK